MCGKFCVRFISLSMAFKLFLFEFHVGTIEFDSTFKPIPKKEETLVNIKFADVSINIDPEEFLFEKNGGKLKLLKLK